MSGDTLRPGSNALVLGPDRERRSFCLDHLATAERTAAVVLPSDPARVVETYERLGGEASLTVVVEEGASGAFRDAPGVRTVTVETGALPAVGEATLATLEGERGSPADRLWIAGLSDLLERASVQQVYRLLFILSKHVRRVDGVGLYGLAESVDRKTAHILRQPLDYEVTLAPESGPETTVLAEQSTGA